MVNSLLPAKNVPSIANKRGWKSWISVVIGVLVPMAFPVGHMMTYAYLWPDKIYPVDPLKCNCGCWDTVFKGPYESNISGYKHVYFNYTENTLKMWIITVLMLIVFYETLKYITTLALKRTLRLSLGILFLYSLHAHYYTWWVYWGYWNDDFYKQWEHQLFFSSTELFSTYLVILSLDKKKSVQPIKLVLIANVAFFRITFSSKDQFIFNVIMQKGRVDQMIRDLWLMSTDCMQVTVAFFELRRFAKLRGSTLQEVVFQKPCRKAVIWTTSIMLLYTFIFL